ncbi:MAG: ABC transporter substrate-binding protein [Defluviitaleaceae bacterium]|nr:ABC transporter substrate-binding protein [Defluviitaleaceae bacterium]
MKKLLFVSFVSLIALTLTACGNQATETAGAGETGTITFATMPALDAFPVFLAYEMGFFADEGLDVNVIPFFAAPERDAAFQAGTDIDGLIFDLIALTLYQQGGIDVIAVASSIGLTYLLGSPEISTLHDLPGHHVLISLNTAMDYVLERALGSVGLVQDYVELGFIPPLSLRLETLLAGHADAAVLPEPFATMAMNEGFNSIVNTWELDINPFSYGFRREVIENRPQDVLAFFRGLNNAVDFLNTADREEFIDILIEVVGYPPETRDTLAVPTFPNFATPQIHHVESVLQFSRDRGLLTMELTPHQAISTILE